MEAQRCFRFLSLAAFFLTLLPLLSQGQQQNLDQSPIASSVRNNSGFPSLQAKPLSGSVFQPYGLFPAQKNSGSSQGTNQANAQSSTNPELGACVINKLSALKVKSAAAIQSAVRDCSAKSSPLNSKIKSNNSSVETGSASEGGTSPVYKKIAATMPRLVTDNLIRQPVPGENGTVLQSFPGPTVFQGTPDKLVPPNPR